MRVAIYARVSTGEQSPDLQLRELRDYAERRGFVVQREYVDHASGEVRRRGRARFGSYVLDLSTLPPPLPFMLPAHARPHSPITSSAAVVFRISQGSLP
jgi:hypothetical protein